MVSPCLLLSLLFTVARAYSKHSTDMRPAPSCEQLRELWYQVNQPREIENEIPILPFHIQNGMERVLVPTSSNARRGKPYKKMFKNNRPYFLDTPNPFLHYSMAVQPEVPPIQSILSKQQAPSNDELNGVFGEFHEQVADEQNIGTSKQQQVTTSSDHRNTKSEVFDSEPPSGVLLGNKKNMENEYFIPQWGLPEEVGTFGSFVDIDLTSPYLPMTRTPKGVKSQWSETSVEIPRTCDAVLNSACRTAEECFCKGWEKLICIHGKCLSRSLQQDLGANEGIWHDRPIPYSELQLLGRPQKRSYSSILM